MQTRKAGVVTKLNNAVAYLMKTNKVDIIDGEAQAKDNATIVVNGEEIGFKSLIIATGSEPRHLPLEGFDEAFEKGFLIDSTGALSLPSIPKDFVVIGGGVIGMEFACMYNELGANVTILQGLPTILEMMDADVAKEMTKIFKAKGIKVLPNSKLVKIKGQEIFFEDAKGKMNSIKADYCLESVGRVPTATGFENLHLTRGRGGCIETDEFLRTNIPNIYAIGDVNGKAMLAHVASKEGLIAVNHILGGTEKMIYTEVPNAMYTHPEVACVGLSEQQAKEQKLDYVKATFPLRASGKALADGSTDGFVKIIAGKKYRDIIGVHIIASTATDMIGEVTTAMASEATTAEIAKAIHPHPTISESLYEAALKIIEIE